MKINYTLLIFGMLLIFACEQKNTSSQQTEQSPTIEKPKPFSTKIDSLIKQGGGPCESDFDCMKIRVVWPIVQHGNEKVRKTLNDSIANYMIQHLGFGNGPKASSLSQSADRLIAEFASEYKENKSFGIGWSYDVDGKIDFHKDIANIQINNYTFTGGAHPNYYTDYRNFNTQTGHLIEYTDFVKDMPAFKTIIENNFKKVISERLGKEIKSDDFFWGEGFQLAKNFKLDEKELEIIYNPYEAAAYAVGEISFRIPYEELNGIIEF